MSSGFIKSEVTDDVICRDCGESFNVHMIPRTIRACEGDTMKCDTCGAERQKHELENGVCRTSVTLPECRDALAAQLASMTKRVEEAEREVTTLRDDRQRSLQRADALTLDTQTCEEATTALVSMVRVARADAERQRIDKEASEAKLATAVKGLTAIGSYDPLSEVQGFKGAQRVARATLRALGIDPIMCSHCEKKPASCIGRYESMTTSEPACDDCCGHGCEDGRCYPLDSDEGRAALSPSAPAGERGADKHLALSYSAFLALTDKYGSKNVEMFLAWAKEHLETKTE